MEKSAAPNPAPAFELIGGNVCLDFINTLDNRPSASPKELLESYGDLVGFAEQSGIIPVRRAKGLRDRARRDPRASGEALRRARELREALYRIFCAVARKGASQPQDLLALNFELHEAYSHLHLEPAEKSRYEFRFDRRPSLGCVLWPIARAAADLLASDVTAMVHTCASPTCQWFFLDTSKNHHRRWCSMKSCGNRSKVRKFYSRQRRDAKQSS